MVRVSPDSRRPRWLVAQRWDNLLFAHWPVEPEAVRRLLPSGIEPDTRDGSAWLAIVPFVMVDTRPYGAPRSAALAPIPELNVRTYVRVADTPAVWFLSLDATSRFFASMGRVLYGLRYRLSRMLVVPDGKEVHYMSAGRDAAFAASYAPSTAPAAAAAGTLEHFLVERYRLFAERRGRLITAEVAHEPWPLQTARARISLNSMAPRGLSLEAQPLLHYCRSMEALISAPKVVPSPRRAPIRGARLRSARAA